ncbi:hypothetical protein MYSE111917_23360 [Mycobacterium senriense]|uniref:Uncharacterized protein n=1 Tax=Mycobacterium senriense TaxID=2775496 RepID=A0ABM7SJ01_9MYCO|nr:hypothetical protein [Mycobacterium senriense]BCZ20411.1 hypothetical protein MTY59_02660 [Mycobacterium senriense]
MNQTAEVGALQCVVAMKVVAKTGTGPLFRRYTAIAEEAERTLASLSERFSSTAQQRDDPDE